MRITAWGCTAALLLGVAVRAQAQVPANPPVTNPPANNVDNLQRQDHTTNRIASPVTMRILRASQLIGKAIENPQGQSVGSVSDFVLDSSSGKIRYLAVTYGGFLGIGDKMFAVPYEAFNWKTDPDDADEHLLVLDVTQQQLEGATGFDQDHWPNFEDATFTSELDKRYRIQRDVDEKKVPNADIDVHRDGVDIDLNRNAPPAR